MDWGGFYGWNPWIGRAEKSNKAERIEQFAKDEFDKIRRRLERTKVMNNEAIIRNGCRKDSESPFRNLPEITLVHIFQFSRPKGFVAEKVADKDEKSKPLKYDNRQHSYWHRQREEREEAEKKQRLEKEIETADLKEMAEAAGSVVVAPPTAGVASASGHTEPAATVAAAATKAEGSSSRTSGRKRSQISYNETAGDKEFEKQLQTFQKQMPVPVLKGFATLKENAAVGNMGDDDGDDDDEEKELRPIEDLLDAPHEPGRKMTFSFLSPDTHLTGPCYRDFNRYIKTFSGWTAKRIEATAEERKKYKFTKKGKAYFTRLIFTLPGTPKKTKAAASKTKPDAKKKSAGVQDGTKKKSDDAPTVEGILAEAAALAVRQREAREAQEPAKKKAKAS